MSTSLSKILSSDPLPLAPPHLDPAMAKYVRDLHAYLIRLLGKFSAENIINSIIADLILNPSIVNLGGSYTGNLRIANYTPTFFGSSIFYDVGSVPTRPGVSPDSYLAESIEWDGTFVNRSGSFDMMIGIATTLTLPPGSFIRQFKIQTAPGQYTNLHSFSRVYISGSTWYVILYIYKNSTDTYSHPIVYKKTTGGASYAPQWGTYTLSPSPDTHTTFEGIGNTFPATLEIEPC